MFFPFKFYAVFMKRKFPFIWGFFVAVVDEPVSCITCTLLIWFL